ncbi:MAG: hypothetical protein WBM40_12185, partial [Thiohalocapsa sp.]
MVHVGARIEACQGPVDERRGGDLVGDGLLPTGLEHLVTEQVGPRMVGGIGLGHPLATLAGEVQVTTPD